MSGKKVWKKFLFTGISVFILALAGMFCVPADAPAATSLVVTSNLVNVRSGPSTSSSIIDTLPLNTGVTSLETKGDWHKVSYRNGSQGWVAGWLLGAATNTNQNNQANVSKKMQATITADNVIIRSGPGSSNSAVSNVKKGDTFNVAEVKGQWIKIDLPGGKSGWVAGWLVSAKVIENKPAPVVSSNNGQSTAVNTAVNNKKATVEGENVYIRGGPGTSHGAVSLVSRGQRLGVLEQAGDWYKVSTDGGIVGWVASWLIDVEQAEASPSVGDPQIVTPDTDQSGNMPAGVVTRLEKLQYSRSGERTLVTIQADNQLNYEMFLLPNPNRLVIDFKNVDPGDVPETIAVGTDTVQQIRTGWFGEGSSTFRIVLDLNGIVINQDRLSADRTQLDLELYFPVNGNYLAGRIIVVDPGHGGQEPGAIGATGVKEKDINLDISLKLAQILRNSGAKVIMTRSSDTTVGLYNRAPLAAGADVFLSVHSNSNTNPSSSGSSTYYRRDTGDIAPGVNQADNRRLASAIQSELLQTLGRRNLGVLQSNFVVVKDAPVPAALAEIAFISNAEELQLLSQDSFRMKAAEALARGLNNFFSTN